MQFITKLIENTKCCRQTACRSPGAQNCKQTDRSRGLPTSPLSSAWVRLQGDQIGRIFSNLLIYFASCFIISEVAQISELLIALILKKWVVLHSGRLFKLIWSPCSAETINLQTSPNLFTFVWSSANPTSYSLFFEPLMLNLWGLGQRRMESPFFAKKRIRK
jgi:hypothetical protein